MNTLVDFIRRLSNRPVSSAVVALAISALVTAAISPSVAFAGTNTYPSSTPGCRYVSTDGLAGTCDLKDSTQDTYYDPWNEENRECTSYVAWMLSSVNGFTMPFYDDAGNWGSDATADGYTVNMTPAVGSVYWTSSPQHVAYVEAVTGGGSTVTLEDYNAAYTGEWAEHTGVATSSASGYIHFKDISTPTPPSPGNWISLAGNWTGDTGITIGLYNPATATFYLRDSNTSGNSDISVQWGDGGDWVPLVGDWVGDGVDTIGLYDPDTATFYLSNSNVDPTQTYTATFGSGGDWVPLGGDWTGDGVDTIGVYNPSTARFYLSNSNSSPTSNISSVFGSGGDWVPLTGDWDNTGYSGIGVYNPSTASFYLSNSNSSPESDYSAVFGSGSDWEPVMGDWDGNGTTTIGVYDPDGATMYLSNENTSPTSDINFTYGNPN